MHRIQWLLLLLALGGTRAQEAKAIAYETGNPGTAEIEISDKGYLGLQLGSDRQNENAKASTELREKLDKALRWIVSDLPHTSKRKKRRAILRNALESLTRVSQALPQLEAKLGAIGEHDKEIVRLFGHQEEWRFWAADQVRKVMGATEGRRTAEAVTVTTELNNRYGARLGSCAGEYIWLQIRFNLDLAKTLDSLRSPTDQMIEASQRCSGLRPKWCRNLVRGALDGLQRAPQDLYERSSAVDQLQESQSRSVRCMEQALEEYREERVQTETRLQDLMQS